MDYIAMAETLEVQAASLRREHVRLELGGDPQLPLDDGARAGQEDESEQPADENEWRTWEGGDGPPAEATGRNVDVVFREGQRPGETGPAAAWVWTHDLGPSDIVEWRISAEQPATP